MRVTEALIRQNERNKQQNQLKRQWKEEDEPTLRYKERNYEYWAINQKKQAFGSPFSDGINTKESIFDKNAIFKTEFRGYKNE